jgi:hypothetical protein
MRATEILDSPLSALSNRQFVSMRVGFEAREAPMLSVVV